MDSITTEFDGFEMKFREKFDSQKKFILEGYYLFFINIRDSIAFKY
jgi:hypothetical protein